jgi:hypothetical protein
MSKFLYDPQVWGLGSSERSEERVRARVAELATLVGLPVDWLDRAVLPPNTPAEFSRHIANDADKWARVIKASGARVD